MQVRSIISFLALSVLVISCGSKKTKEVEEGKIRPVAYSEGDTLELDPYPPSLSSWLDFFHNKFPDFKNGNFGASGVVLHLEQMPPADGTSGSTPTPYDRIAYNPDSSSYISIFGSTQGDIDQSVTLWKKGPSDRGHVIMNNGPNVTVETADWLANDVFILSRTTVDVKKGTWSPEIYLFSLNDSTFTNFTWTRTVPVDSVIGAADVFLLDSLKSLKKISH